jgi:predicted DNA-binding protein with PD1-like motif
LHIAISDSKGQTYGAHLLESSEVYTAAEIVIASLEDLIFLRTYDTQTDYPELDIRSNAESGSEGKTRAGD